MISVEVRSPETVAVPAVAGISRTSKILVPLLITLFVLQCAWFIRTQSFTIDEPEHIVAGLEAWRFGEFKRWHDQPPLSRLLFVLPLVRTDWKYQIIDEEVHPVQPAPEVWLYRARAVNVVLGIAFMLLLWGATRRLFSESAANFVLALAVLSPEFVAHFSLATMDGIGTLFVFALVVQLVRWWRNPSRVQTLLLALTTGGLLLSKFNSPPLVALALLFVLILKPHGVTWRPRLWNWARACTIAAIAALVVWTGYFFHVSKVVFAHQSVTITFPAYTKLLTYEMPTLSRPIALYWPACEWFTGLGMVVYHNMEGHRSFFLGHFSKSGGWPLYFPVAMLLKWPPIVLLLAAAGIFYVLWRRIPARRELLLMSLFPAVYLVFALSSRINIGVRHVLPLYPFLLLFAAATWEWASQARKAKFFLYALLLLQCADTARFAPDYLSYFTPAIPSTRSYEYLSDSNVDWGQGLVALRKYQAAHPTTTLHLAYFGLVDPSWYGIRYVPLRESDRATGTVVVSSTHLSGQLLANPTAYHWLLKYPRTALLDHTLYVFEVPETANAAGQ